MPDDAYQVGRALAYLVKRMEMFCGATDSAVLMYKRSDRAGIPQRMPAVDALRAQARHYPAHRHLYPEDHQEVLDASIAVIGDQEAISAAVEGFVSTLSATSATAERDKGVT